MHDSYCLYSLSHSEMLEISIILIYTSYFILWYFITIIIIITILIYVLTIWLLNEVVESAN